MNERAQQAVVQVLNNAIETLGECGLQVAAYHRGELVVDAVAGIADPETGRTVQHDTPFLVFSCSKGVTATLVHRLHEAGLVDYDAPIARYWPAFARHDKSGITVRDALTHRAGLPEIANVSWLDQWNLADAGRALEGASTIWEPRSTLVYHPVTFGSILGNLVVRVTGRSFADAVKAEISERLGVPDLKFGIDSSDVLRASTRAVLISAGTPTPETGISPPSRDETEQAERVVSLGNDPRWIHGCMPAANLTTSARALARFYASLGPDGVDGLRLLRDETLTAAVCPSFGDDGSSLSMGMGLGFQLGGMPEVSPTGQRLAPWRDAFGHDGAGGRVAMVSPRHRLAVALTKNAVTPGRYSLVTWRRVLESISGSLGIAFEAEECACGVSCTTQGFSR